MSGDFQRSAISTGRMGTLPRIPPELRSAGFRSGAFQSSHPTLPGRRPALRGTARMRPISPRNRNRIAGTRGIKTFDLKIHFTRKELAFGGG